MTEPAMRAEQVLVASVLVVVQVLVPLESRSVSVANDSYDVYDESFDLQLSVWQRAEGRREFAARERLLEEILNRISATEDGGGACVTETLYGVNVSDGQLSQRVLARKQAAVHAARVLESFPETESPRDLMSALARSVLDGRQELAAVAIAYRRGASSDPLAVYAYHDDAASRVQPLSQRFNQSSVEWFWKVAMDNDDLDVSWNQSSDNGAWTQPFWDCGARKWLFGYSVPFFDRSGDLPFFKGAAAVFFTLDSMDIDQCNESNPLFGGTHKCDVITTMCVTTSGHGFKRGGYECRCRPGYFLDHSNASWRGFPGEEMEAAFSVGYSETTRFRCLPCSSQCDGCYGGDICRAEYDYLMRCVLLGIQILAMCICAVLACIVFKQRKCKTIASGMWTMLETILLGAFLLYATVVIRFFEPSIVQCFVEPWCRELGFVVCYGAIILKLYRILIEFRTRKAHRWVVRDKDLLKYLLGMVVVVFGYMAAWTATNLNFLQENYSLLAVGRTFDGLQFLACKTFWWDYVTETGEILIILFGLRLSFMCRNATSQFQERRFLCLALVVELLVSGAFYILRVIFWSSLHPDYMFLVYFGRSQLTCTFVLLLIFLPKLWYHHHQAPDSKPKHYLAQEMQGRDAFKPQDGVTLNSDMDAGEINLTDMNPEDIRAELKRLYTQLEVLKNKTIRADNPHISKRRGGRKAAHRRFSLQALHHRSRCSTRHHHSGDHETTEAEVSRTPEDSVCSVEGPSAIYNDGPSTYSEIGFGTPNVSYKSSHK